MSQSTIGEYTILPLTVPSIPSFPLETTHSLYLRPHTPKIPTEDDSRSLFLVNVPIDSTHFHLRAVFTSLIGAGRFESVTFEHEQRTKLPWTQVHFSRPKRESNSNSNSKKRKRNSDGVAEVKEELHELPRTWNGELRRSGSSAVVVLVDEKSVEMTLKAVKKIHQKKKKPGLWPTWGEGISTSVSALGSRRYLSHHQLRYPDPIELQQNVDAFMIAFNEHEKNQKEINKRTRNEPDADGFVTVTRGGRAGPARLEAAEEKKREAEEKERQKRAELEKMGFYRFQGRERRKAEMEGLVRKFEEDKEKVEKIRLERGKFRLET